MNLMTQAPRQWHHPLKCNVWVYDLLLDLQMQHPLVAQAYSNLQYFLNNHLLLCNGFSLEFLSSVPYYSSLFNDHFLPSLPQRMLELHVILQIVCLGVSYNLTIARANLSSSAWSAFTASAAKYDFTNSKSSLEWSSIVYTFCRKAFC